MTANGGVCTCDSGYVYISGSCQQCLFPCSTCAVTTSDCLSCLDANMIMTSTPKCLCGPGYYLSTTVC